MNVANRQGTRYYITFIDDHSRYGCVFFISHKNEAIDFFKTFTKEVQNKFDKKIKTLRTDRGGEYTSEILKVFAWKMEFLVN